MKLLYIDVETTGLDPKKDAIIQIAGIISCGDSHEEFNFNIKPREGVELTEESFSLHKISWQEMQAFPSSGEVFQKFSEILAKYVNKFDRKDKFFLVGYNCEFDTQFIRSWFLENNDNYFGSWFFVPSLDVMNLAAFHLIGVRSLLPNFKLSTVYEYLLKEELAEAHDAMADVTATKKILAKILENQRKL